MEVVDGASHKKESLEVEGCDTKEEGIETGFMYILKE